MKRIRETDAQYNEFYDLRTPIDVDTAIQGLDGNALLYHSLLRRFKEKSMFLAMLKIGNTINQEDFRSLDGIITTLQTATKQIGAGRLSYICQLILEAIDYQ